MLAATLFSGIGAPEEAMSHWDWRWCAEIDKFACAVLAQRHPHSVNLGDVAAHDFTERAAAIAKPDVIVFGSPCQSFSVAGQRLGLDDPRGNLALVALGIVDRLKPRWFVFENVPGLMSSAGGSDFGLFLRTVDELGYCCAWSVLDAQYFGVAQRRERVFVVGHLGADWRRPAAVLLEPEGVRGHHPPRRKERQRITPTISARTSAGGGLGTDHDINGGLITAQDAPDIAWALQERDAKGADSDTKKGHLIVADPISANEGKTYSHEGKNNFRLHNVVSHALTAEGFDASEDGTGRGPPLTVTPILEAGARTGKSTDDIRAGMGVGKPGDPMFTLQADKQHAIAFQTNAGRDFTADDDRSPPLRSEGIGGVSGVSIAFTCKDSGGDMGEDIAPTLRAMNALDGRSTPNGGGQVAVAFMENQRGEVRVSEQANSLNSTGGKPGQGYQAVAIGLSTQQEPKWADDVSPTLTIPSKSGGGQPTAVAIALRGREGGSTAEMSELPSALRASQGGGDKAHVMAYSIMPQNSGKDYKARPVEVAQPLMAGGPTTGNQGGDFIASSAVRRLTPRECERLQGFKDDFTLIAYRGKPAADGPRYRALGNSMAVPVVRWILQRIEHLERDR